MWDSIMFYVVHCKLAKTVNRGEASGMMRESEFGGENKDDSFA